VKKLKEKTKKVAKSARRHSRSSSSSWAGRQPAVSTIHDPGSRSGGKELNRRTKSCPPTTSEHERGLDTAKEELQSTNESSTPSTELNARNRAHRGQQRPGEFYRRRRGRIIIISRSQSC
jgi:hypothetical protein